MIVACVGLAFICLLRFGPDVPLLRALRMATVEVPARWLPWLGRHQIAAYLIIAAIILAGGKLMVAFAPDLVALVATNLGIYFDAIAVSLLLTMASIARRVTRSVSIEFREPRSFVSRTLRRSVREVRKRTVVSKRAAENDDEPAARAARAA